MEELNMKVLYTVNNYMLGAKVKSTTTDKIILQNRIDKTHTEIVYQFENIRQKESCDKILAFRCRIYPDDPLQSNTENYPLYHQFCTEKYICFPSA